MENEAPSIAMEKAEDAVIVGQPQESQLQRIVKESGLRETKAQIILKQFNDYFQIAADMERKAVELTVTSPEQVEEMRKAREARLFLVKKRVEIEKTRKELKDESLQEGRTIDSIAGVLKNLLTPIEDRLEASEKFIELREARLAKEREDARIKIMREAGMDYAYYDLKGMSDEQFDQVVEGHKLAEAKKKADAEKAAAEAKAKAEAEAAERKRQQEEIERLRKENAEKERLAKEAAAKAEAERKRLLAEAEAREKAIREEKARAEAEARAKEKALREAQERAEAEKKRLEAIAAQKLADERAKAKAEQEALQAELDRREAEALAKAKEELAEKRRIERERKKAESAPDKAKLLAFAKTLSDLHIPTMSSESGISLVPKIREDLNAIVAFIKSMTDEM